MRIRAVFPALSLALAAAPALAQEPWLDGGHLKARLQAFWPPGDSLMRDITGDVAADEAGALRLKFAAQPGPLRLDAHYQLLATHGDSLSLSAALPAPGFGAAGAIDDDRRWWDLTHVTSEGDSSRVVQRLDRLSVGWTGAKTAIRFGRQAVSWGNGLIFTPMDVFNPFDPTAVDTEYKPGDDMLYAQYLLDSGDDWQLVNVQRRDADGRVDSAVSSSAFKYHGFGAEREFDVLLAQHYDKAMLGAGGLANLGGAVLRGDLVLADTDSGWVTSLVANWSWSWVLGGRNASVVAEYYYNGFGLRESDYDELVTSSAGECPRAECAPAASTSSADELLARLARGELYTIGRHYAAASLLLEVTPLVNLTGNLFCNLGDGSALAQLVLQWDAAQDWRVLGALSAPLGDRGTEYGGLETGVGDTTLATGPALFAQIAWYF